VADATLDALRGIAASAFAGSQLFFLDVLFKSAGQDYVAQRHGARNRILGVELAGVALWAWAGFYLRLDRAIAAAAEAALAVAGTLLTLAGTGLMVWGKLRLGRWFCATFAVKRGHQLVTDGPYAVTRHPIYTGLLGSVYGLALTFDSALTLALAAMLSATLFVHTVHEEALFVEHFGTAYRDYRCQVPRLVPFLRPRGKS
jgi:protein-S-isoprenylcysteine O-methyltransferase Ste14